MLCRGLLIHCTINRKIANRHLSSRLHVYHTGAFSIFIYLNVLCTDCIFLSTIQNNFFVFYGEKALGIGLTGTFQHNILQKRYRSSIFSCVDSSLKRSIPICFLSVRYLCLKVFVLRQIAICCFGNSFSGRKL